MSSHSNKNILSCLPCLSSKQKLPIPIHGLRSTVQQLNFIWWEKKEACNDQVCTVWLSCSFSNKTINVIKWLNQDLQQSHSFHPHHLQHTTLHRPSKHFLYFYAGNTATSQELVYTIMSFKPHGKQGLTYLVFMRILHFSWTLRKPPLSSQVLTLSLSVRPRFDLVESKPDKTREIKLVGAGDGERGQIVSQCCKEAQVRSRWSIFINNCRPLS